MPTLAPSISLFKTLDGFRLKCVHVEVFLLKETLPLLRLLLKWSFRCVFLFSPNRGIKEHLLMHILNYYLVSKLNTKTLPLNRNLNVKAYTISYDIILDEKENQKNQ